MNEKRFNKLMEALSSDEYQFNMETMKFEKLCKKTNVFNPVKISITYRNFNLNYCFIFEGKKLCYSVHEIYSAIIFGRDIIDKICNFKDGNKMNIKESNLEWNSKRKAAGGADHYKHVLTEEQVSTIRNCLDKKTKELSDLFHVARSTIKNVRAKRSYKFC